MNFDPAVYNKDLENGIVPNRDFEVFIYKNIISEEQNKLIYEEVEKIKDKYMTQEFVGHRAWTFYNEELYKYLNIWMSNLLGERMILTELSFARYSNEYGYQPKLFPHFDTHAKDGQRITLDIQLNATTPWAVVVEGESFNLQNNDGLVFAGTQQIHWREKKTLSDKDRIDMLFAHFAYAETRPWGKDQKLILEYWSHRIRQQVGIDNAPVIIDKKEV